MEIGIIQYFQNQSNMFKLFMRRPLGNNNARVLLHPPEDDLGQG
jgi:hypothetical protein